MSAYHHPEKPHFMEFIATANLPQGKNKDTIGI